MIPSSHHILRQSIPYVGRPADAGPDIVERLGRWFSQWVGRLSRSWALKPVAATSSLDPLPCETVTIIDRGQLWHGVWRRDGDLIRVSSPYGAAADEVGRRAPQAVAERLLAKLILNHV